MGTSNETLSLGFIGEPANSAINSNLGPNGGQDDVSSQANSLNEHVKDHIKLPVDLTAASMAVSVDDKNLCSNASSWVW